MEPRMVLSAEPLVASIAPFDFFHRLLSEMPPQQAEEALARFRSTYGEGPATSLEVLDFLETFSAPPTTSTPPSDSAIRQDRQVAAIRAEVVDSAGDLVTEFEVGAEYSLRVYVRDARRLVPGDDGGVFAAAVNLFFTPNLTSLEEIRFASDFSSLRKSGVRSDGALTGTTIEHVGAVYHDFVAPGQDEQFFFETDFLVNSDRVPAEIRVTPSTLDNEPMLLFGATEAVPLPNISVAERVLPFASPSDDVLEPNPVVSDPAPPLVDAIIEPAPAGEEPTSDNGVALVSLVTTPSNPLFESGDLDEFVGEILAPPDETRPLLQPWFGFGRSRTAEQAEALEDDEGEHRDEVDGLIELDLPTPKLRKRETPKSTDQGATEEQEETPERPLDDQAESEDLRRRWWDDALALEGEWVEPLRSRFRMQYRVIPLSTARSERAREDEGPGDLADEMIDLAEILRPHRAPRLPSTQNEMPISPPAFARSGGRIEQAAESIRPSTAGARGSSITFDVDGVDHHVSRQARLQRETPPETPRPSGGSAEGWTVRDPPES